MSFPGLADWRRCLANQWEGCPWPGPRPLAAGTDDPGRLASRSTRDLPEIIDEILSHRLMILSGESGVGKSSLVSLGLLPELQGEPDSGGFLVVELRDWSRAGAGHGLGKKSRKELAEELIIDALRKHKGLVERCEKATSDEFGQGTNISDQTVKTPEVKRALKQLGPQLMIVFDQFEELIRYDEEFFRGVSDFIVELNTYLDCSLLLSLRSEYTHKLRYIETRARPFTVTKYVLEPLVAADEIREVIEGATDQSSSGGDLVVDVDSVAQGKEFLNASYIEKDASERILELWQEQMSGSQGSSAVGLLHLQALLYELYFKAREKCADTNSNPMITVDLLEEFENQPSDRGETDGTTPSADIFRSALTAAVSRKLKQCEDAYLEAAAKVAEQHGGVVLVDEPLLFGTRDLIRRITPHLSSGGYKQVHAKWDLARRVLESEITELGLMNQGEKVERVFTRMASLDQDDEGLDLLTSPRSELAKGVLTPEELGESKSSDEPRSSDSPYLTNEGLHPAPWKVDPEDRSAGVMLGQSPWAVLIEEFRRYLFAIEWMEQAQLIRPTTLRQGTTMLSLIHDRFSDALIEWSTNVDRTGAMIHSVTATRGKEIDLQTVDPDRWSEWGRVDLPAVDDAQEPDRSAAESVRVLANLRWRDSTIRGSFRRVVFVNCDFRGSRFRSCTFEGVSFYNCLLDGVSFDGYDIIGVPELTELVDSSVTVETDVLPSFRVPVDRGYVMVLDRYQQRHRFRGDSDVEFPGVLSITSGLPVRSVVNDSETGNEVFEPLTRGLGIFGGRLNSITFIANVSTEVDTDEANVSTEVDTDEAGGVLLSNITGSSLDFVDQRVANIQIRSSLIRGLSMTGPVGQIDRIDGWIRLVAANAILASAWFGERLRGTADFLNCQMLQIANLSGGVDYDWDGTRSGQVSGASNGSGLEIRLDEKSYPLDVTSFPSKYRPSKAGADPMAFLSPKTTQTDFRRDPARHEIEASRSDSEQK